MYQKTEEEDEEETVEETYKEETHEKKRHFEKDRQTEKTCFGHFRLNEDGRTSRLLRV